MEHEADVYSAGGPPPLGTSLETAPLERDMPVRGHKGHTLYLVKREGDWKIRYDAMYMKGSWQMFFSGYCYMQADHSYGSPSERDATKEVGDELLKLFPIIAREWNKLEEGRPATGDFNMVALDLMRCNYLPVRYKAHAHLVKAFGVDHGIGDDFVPNGVLKNRPEWYRKWYPHR